MLCADFRAKNAKLATRQASGAVLDALVPAVPELIGGSADLTPSNNTRAKGEAEVRPGDFSGRYIHFGVREMGMAAAMNGIAAHGGLIPYGGTFLTFTDYARPAIRLSALMEARVIYVMTHDSIGLGEDGPTHQPVEHLAALRAIPHLLVFRPADSVETAGVLGAGAEAPAGAVDPGADPAGIAAAAHRGGRREPLRPRRLCPRRGRRRAPGDACSRPAPRCRSRWQARDALARDGIGAAVVSMPCWELFEREPAAYRAAVLGTAPRVGIEAAVRLGWDRWLGERSAFIGMTGFGASAPIEALYPHFGITAERVAEAARSLLS